MTIFNLGSINADHFYAVPHLPGPGETLAALTLSTGLGGKGANQSVAAARAGTQVRHLGAVGPDGAWAVARLAALGVDTAGVATVDQPTGHAIICIDKTGENQILLYPGANRAVSRSVLAALSEGMPGDWLMLQNETNLLVEAASAARKRGLQVAVSAAPFDPSMVREILPFTDLLLLNVVEARQLTQAMGVALTDLPVPQIVVTKGAEGAEWHDLRVRESVSVPAHSVAVVDTTGAGDTFAGYFVAALSQGAPADQALHLATAAAAVKVTRAGTADAIPLRADVEALLAS